MEIEIGFGAFWRIFVSKRQLQCFTFCEQKLNEFFPLQGVILFPAEPNLDASCVHSPPPVDALMKTLQPPGSTPWLGSHILPLPLPAHVSQLANPQLVCKATPRVCAF